MSLKSVLVYVAGWCWSSWFGDSWTKRYRAAGLKTTTTLIQSDVLELFQSQIGPWNPKVPPPARGRVTENKPSVGDGASIHHSLEVYMEDQPDLWIFEFSEQRQHFAEMWKVFNFTVLCRLLIS